MNLNPNSKVGNGDFRPQKWAVVIFLFPEFFQGFSRFCRVFQCFSRFFNVFQDISRFLIQFLMKGRPREPNFGQEGVVFFNFEGKIVFGDPPLPQAPTPA